MTNALTFPADEAMSAMGPKGHKWLAHYDRGEILFESEDAIVSGGRGRGNKRKLSVEAIVQGTIALGLIDAGLQVKEAYVIGAKFAYSGGYAGPFLTDENANVDPARDRHAGHLFRKGRTLLVCRVETPLKGKDGFHFISDADPTYQSFENVSQASLIIDAVDSPDGAPLVVMNVTAVCDHVCDVLGLDRKSVFGGEAV